MSISTFLFPCYASPCGRKEEEKKEKKKNTKSHQSHVRGDMSIMSVGHSTWQSKTFILLYQCKPRGQRAHGLFTGGHADPDNWPVYHKQESLLLHRVTVHHQLCCKAHNPEQIYRKVVEGAFFPTTVAQNTRDFSLHSDISPCHPFLPFVLPGLKLFC